MDWPLDVRDLLYDVTNFEFTKEHIGQTLLDAVAFLPIIGVVKHTDEVADVVKAGAKYADEAADALKSADKIADAVKAVEKISPAKLTPTHKLTLSKKQYSNLVENIQNNGITESIKYVEYNGHKYVVDGHHRLMVAKQLGLDKIPAQKVSLPYKGYKTITDLLWLE